LVAGVAVASLTLRNDGDTELAPGAGPSSSPDWSMSFDESATPTASPTSSDPTPLKSVCDDEVLSYLPGAERADEVGYPSGRTLLAFHGTLTPTSIPSTVILDKQGRVAASILGEVPGKETLVDLVRDVENGSAS
jgi:hypothetical protein